MHEDTYEDRYATPLERRYARVQRWYHWPVKGMLRQPRYFLVELRWRLGDEVMAIPFMEDLVAAWPHDQIVLWCSYPEIFRHIPRLSVVTKAPKQVDRYCLLRDASRRRKRYEEMAQRLKLPVPERGASLPVKGEVPEILQPVLDRGKPVIALAPATTWANKHWLPARWQDLSGRLGEMGYSTVEVGANHEVLGLGEDLVGKTDILTLAAMLEHVDGLITLDSGVMHMALAVGAQTVALFGPTLPEYYVQPAAHFHPVCSTDPCAGFWNLDRAIPEAGRCLADHDSCLESITVDRVLEQLKVVTG